MSRVPFVAMPNVHVRVSMVVTGSSQSSFDYHLSSTVGIDLSNNLLHGEIPQGLFALQGLEYLNLSHNFLDGHVPGLEKMSGLKALDLSHNSLSGQVPGNVSSLKDLTLLNLSYNSFSGFVPKKQGYWRFPGAFAGNPDLCVETSSGRCETESIPMLPGLKGFYPPPDEAVSFQMLL
nr:leucine-rich repeat receptor-like protein clavata2 [Quercus suber]